MGDEEVAAVRTHEDQEKTARRVRRALAGAACLLGALVTLGGCAVGPKFVKPEVALNPDWAEQGDSLVDTHASPDSAWWRCSGSVPKA